MTLFDQREKSFEAKFQHDEELRFKVVNRRNRLLGYWAAGMMDLHSDAATDYARELVEIGIGAGGEEPIYQRVHKDLLDAGKSSADAYLPKQMRDLMHEARAELMQE